MKEAKLENGRTMRVLSAIFTGTVQSWDNLSRVTGPPQFQPTVAPAVLGTDPSEQCRNRSCPPVTLCSASCGICSTYHPSLSRVQVSRESRCTLEPPSIAGSLISSGIIHHWPKYAFRGERMEMSGRLPCSTQFLERLGDKERECPALPLPVLRSKAAA